MKYPLQTDNFNFIDRLKVALFLLNKKNRLTFGPKILKLEETWEQICDNKVNCFATSSGSTANHLLVETFLQNFNYKPENITVFVPSTTWASSITPWIMRGCEIVFIDINLQDFSFNYTELKENLENRKNDGKIKVIWPTALVGFIPDVGILKNLKDKYKNTYLFADLCETTIGEYKNQNILNCFDMASTSFFWAHEICGIELGMLFLNKEFTKNTYICENAQMIRSHGLTRMLNKNNKFREEFEINYPEVDKEFLFGKIGTNYRSTDLNAYFCLIDTQRYHKYKKFRNKIWNYFLSKLPKDFKQLNPNITPFCLPIINDKIDINKLKHKLNSFGWETRPIICYLPINPCFKEFAENKVYKNSDYLNKYGFYVGLNKDLTKKDIDILINLINDDTLRLS
jgi:dTDP-4-amino-4,6-dideoxygalactose transaminase